MAQQRQLTPEEAERWKAIATQYRTTQLKLRKKRDELKALLDTTAHALKAVAHRDVPGVALLKAQKRMTEFALRQIEAFDVDANVYAPPTESQSPQFQSRQFDLTLATIQLDDVVLAELARIVAADLRPAPAPEAQTAPLSGTRPLKRGTGRLKTPTRPLPPLEPWLVEHALLEGDAERRGLWEKFLDAQVACREALDALKNEPAPPPGPERLAWLKRTVPALKGLNYRVHSALRLLPTGEDIAKALREKLIADLDLENAVAPAARGQGKKPGTGITDRLLDIFKPPS